MREMIGDIVIGLLGLVLCVSMVAGCEARGSSPEHPIYTKCQLP